MVGTKSLWRHGAFMRVWAGSTISQVGDQITVLALPWLVLQLTHSPVQLGIVVGLENLPFLLFTLIAGVYADRWDRRTIMLTCDLVRFAALATLPLAAAVHGLTMAQIYAVAFVTGTGRVWFDVARYAMLPSILTEAQLVDGNSKFFASEGASSLVGPSVGGFLIKLFGAANAILADALSFLVSAAAIISLPSLRATEAPAERGWRAQLAAGFRYLFGHRIILENALFLLMFLLFQTMIQAVYVFYAQHELHLDAGLTGVMFALAGTGPLLIAPLAPRIRRRLRMGQVLVLVTSISWMTIAILDVAPLLPKLVALAVVGLAGGIDFGLGTLWNVVTISYRQSVIPSQLMARVNSALRFISWGIIPLASVLGGLLTQTIGIRSLIAISAAGLFAMFIILARFSEIRKV
jgi:Transmembrane secretion effector